MFSPKRRNIKKTYQAVPTRFHSQYHPSTSPESPRLSTPRAISAVVLLAGYFGNCFLMGWLLPRVTHLNRAEAMLIATPAGASDMALISSDLGVDNPDVAFLQVLRMIIVVTVFPHIVNLVLHLVGG